MYEVMGGDASSWNGIIRFHQLDPKIKFIIFRSTISYLGVDKNYATNRKAYSALGGIFGTYHFVYPGQGALKQFLNIAKVVGDNPGQLGVWLDYEQNTTYSPTRITDEFFELSGLLEKEYGHLPGIYSRAEWVNRCMLPGSWRNKYDWWIAHYLTDRRDWKGPAFIPTGVDRRKLIFHQTTDKGNLSGGGGKAWGWGSHGFDVNWYTQPASTWDAYVNKRNPVVVAPPVPEKPPVEKPPIVVTPATLEQRVTVLEKDVEILKSKV